MQKKKKSKELSIIQPLDFGIFPGICSFIVNFSKEEVIKIWKKDKEREWIGALKLLDDDLWSEDTGGFCSKRTFEGRIYYFLVLNKPFDFSDEQHNTLAHEALHLVSFHLPQYLDPIEENECFCYTHTHILKQCYKILRGK